MSWNYRAVKRDGSIEFYEVYYDEKGKVRAIIPTPVAPGGANKKELLWTLNALRKAANKPVLQWSRFEQRLKDT